jgi:hypothetical protein
MIDFGDFAESIDLHKTSDDTMIETKENIVAEIMVANIEFCFDVLLHYFPVD